MADKSHPPIDPLLSCRGDENAEEAPSRRVADALSFSRPGALQARSGFGPNFVVTIPSRHSLEDGINRLASGETNLDSHLHYLGTSSGRGIHVNGLTVESEPSHARLGMPAPASAFATLNASRL